MIELEVLQNSVFGHRTAEEERENLRAYFVETEQWRQVFGGHVDVVYGPKGSGKSAIYSLLSQSTDELFDRKVIVVPGENPQGAPAFKDIGNDPPYNEAQFVNLWKLYILTLCGHAIKDYGLSGDKCDEIINALEEAELLPAKFSLAKVLKYALDYVRAVSSPEAVESEIYLDPATGMPINLKGRIVFREPSASAAKSGIVSVDELFQTASDALEQAGYTIWVVLDRLDVAFAGSEELETAALRALFKFYLDTKANKNISTKIFLRTDIWSNITADGFREASHIERALSIEWSTEDLTNLVARRALSNTRICEYYRAEPDEILSDYASQEKFLAGMFPDQVETGPNKPKTFQWILGRTRDSTHVSAPRELIHFLTELRGVQINRMERGEANLSGGRLFEQISFKEALPAVSKIRLEQTLFAEYPSYRSKIEALKEQKATQPLANLAAIWNMTEDEAAGLASQLEQVGFFEKLGGMATNTWRVPFLYRPALSLIQGSADIAMNDD